MKLKNEAAVGLVVILGILTALAGAVFLSGQPWNAPQKDVVATFDEVGALAEGNPVVYRGVNVGRVSGIELSPRGTGVYVTMAVTPDLQLPPDAAVLLASASMFGDWQAEIISQAKYPDLEFTTAPRRGVLPGAALPDISELTAVAARIAADIETLSARIQIAFTPETAVKIRETIENVEEVSDQLSGFIDQQTRVYGQVGQNVLATTANIRQASGSAQAAMEEMRASLRSGDIQQTMANARRASANLEALSRQLSSATGGLPALMARADTTLGAFGRTAESLNTTIAGLQPALEQAGPTLAEARSAITNFNALLTSLQNNQGTVGRLLLDPALYEETQRLITSMQRLMADIQANPAKYIGEVQVF
ncbi:MAG TPA: MlaD family protein [Longimicrobium sp.]|nr:MlaD family protein [Longimicrobium sp.]